MSDGHYDAPAYCAICDRPIATGPTCDECDQWPDDEADDSHLEAAYEERYELDE